MQTTEARLPYRFLHRPDTRLIDMLEGALFPLRRPPPIRAENDFLVINPHDDLSDLSPTAPADAPMP